MAQPTDLDDWELLQASDSDLSSIPDPSDVVYLGEAAIMSDYFVVDPGDLDSNRAVLDGDTNGEALPDSDDQPKGELGFEVSESPNSGKDPILEAAFGGAEDSTPEGDFETIGAVASNESTFGGTEASEITDDLGGGAEISRTEAVDAEQQNSVGDGVFEEEESEGEVNSDELRSGESVRTGDSMAVNNKKAALPALPSREAGERGKVWLKLPLDLLKWCVLRARPIWSISVVAAILGIVLLGRRLYKMKHKTRSNPLKITIDDKKASQIMVRAARLNDAFSVVRRVPVIRSPLPASGVSLWPVIGLL